jgi:sulfur-carrier protein adenylyltransferase/sulfurtransferase
MAADISVQDLHKKLKNGEKVFILDVREEFEYDISNIRGYLIPVGELENRLFEIDDKKELEVVVHCRTGKRSADAVKILEENGFKNARNLAGGINEWAEQIDRDLPVY